MSLIDKDVISEIANQLSIPISKIYEIYVQAQPIIGIMSLVCILGWAISSVYLIYTLNKKLKDNYDKSFTMYLGGMFGIAALGFIWIAIYEAVIAIMMPEYVAINSLLHVLG